MLNVEFYHLQTVLTVAMIIFQYLVIHNSKMLPETWQFRQSRVQNFIKH